MLIQAKMLFFNGEQLKKGSKYETYIIFTNTVFFTFPEYGV